MIIFQGNSEHKNFVGTKIAFIIASQIDAAIPSAVIEVYTNNNQYRAKLEARLDKKRIRVQMREGQISVFEKDAAVASSVIIPIIVSQDLAAISLADPKVFDKVTKKVTDLLVR